MAKPSETHRSWLAASEGKEAFGITKNFQKARSPMATLPGSKPKMTKRSMIQPLDTSLHNGALLHGIGT